MSVPPIQLLIGITGIVGSEKFIVAMQLPSIQPVSSAFSFGGVSHAVSILCFRVKWPLTFLKLTWLLDTRLTVLKPPIAAIAIVNNNEALMLSIKLLVMNQQ